jgi:hypothetical protein
MPQGEDPEEIWEETGWSLFVPETGGVRGAVVFPLNSERYTAEQFDLLSKCDQLRCVKDTPDWCYCARNNMHGKEHSYEYMANAVRAAGVNEKANCRIILDWEWNKELGYERRCVLVSTMECAKGHEWLYDADFARRSQEAVQDDSSDDSSVEIVGHRGSSTRPLFPSERDIETAVLNREVALRLVDSLDEVRLQLAAIENRLNKLENKLGTMRTDNLEIQRKLLRLADQVDVLVARPSQVNVQVEEQVDSPYTFPPYSPVVHSNP